MNKPPALLGPLHGLDLHGIGWVIAGGESGLGAHPMDPGWPARLRGACQAAGVPYFFKLLCASAGCVDTSSWF